MTKYVYRPVVYGFIQWTGSNLTECQEICEEYVTLTQDGGTLYSNQGVGVCSVGQFVRSDGYVGYPNLDYWSEVSDGSAYSYDITTTP